MDKPLKLYRTDLDPANVYSVLAADGAEFDIYCDDEGRLAFISSDNSEKASSLRAQLTFVLHGTDIPSSLLDSDTETIRAFFLALSLMCRKSAKPRANENN